jgi:hypothetical protein
MNIYYDGVLKVSYNEPKWIVHADEYLWLSDGASFGLVGDYFTKLAVGTLTNAYFDYVRVWKSTKNNVALGKPVLVESFDSQSANGDKLVDRNKTDNNSRWISGINSLPTWAEIDLGGSYTVNGFMFFTGTSGFNLPLKNFQFQYWNGTSWINAYIKSANTSSIVEEYFAPVTTNKIRLYITGTTDSYARIYELEVYGVTTTLDVKQFEKKPFIIYSNEVNNGVFYFSGDQEIQSVEVYSTLEKKMDTTFENGILEVGNLSSGVYFAKVNNQHSLKFIKP